MRLPCRPPSRFRRDPKLRSRPSWIHALSVASLLIGATPAHAQSVVVRLDMTGPPEVKSLIENRLMPRGMSISDEFELRRRLAQALAEAREVLESLGFYGAKVEAGLTEAEVGWVVRINAMTGEQTRVCAVDLRFEGAIAKEDHAGQNAARLRALWSLRDGEAFRHVDWEVAKASLEKAASDRVYAGARIKTSQAEIDPATHCARLTVVLDSGPVVRFGPLSISGLDRYDRRIVENLNKADAGNVFDQDALLRFQLALQQSGFFSAVNVTAQPDSVDPSLAPVQVRVEEQRLKALNLGAGFSTNTGYRGQVDYVQNSILDRPLKLSTSLKLETKAQSARADLLWPREAGGWQWSLGSRIERKEVQDVITRSYANFVQRGKSAGDIDRIWTLTYLLEDESVAGMSPTVNRALMLNHAWTIRRLKPILFPDSGYALNVQLGGASRALLSEQDFVRTHVKLVVLHPFNDKTFVTLRGEAGVVAAQSREGIPLDFLFRTGGSASVRGYGYESLGVRQGSAVVGGRYLAVGSVELTRWLTKDWGGAVFVDAGGASDSWQDYKASIGYGAGARLRTPVGPLSLDLAFAEETRTLRLHFNLSIPF